MGAKRPKSLVMYIILVDQAIIIIFFIIIIIEEPLGIKWNNWRRF